MALTLEAAIVAGDIWQLKDGRAAYKKGSAGSVGDRANFETDGQVVVPKTTGIVILDGGRVYWDASASKAHFKKVNDRDLYIGRAVGDAASVDTEMTVNLNVDPRYDIDVTLDPCISTPVGTAAAGGFGYPVQLGGANVLEITATNEAQKVELMSTDGFALTANAIVEFAFRVLSDGGSGTQDMTIGAASGTNATDFESVAEFVAIHLDGNVTAINVESDDGTTDVPPTDSTKVYVEGSAIAQRVEVWMDFRDRSDVQVYVDGVLVLASTVFTLALAAGPLFLIAHLEKTATTDVYTIAFDWLRARFSEQ